MNKPENEMLLMVLEKKTSKTGKEYYTGFMGLNSIYANESNGKLYVNIQKWPKKDADSKAPSFVSTEDDVGF